MPLDMGRVLSMEQDQTTSKNNDLLLKIKGFFLVISKIQQLNIANVLCHHVEKIIILM
jgi:hypothetical protein